jgi:hypothetical protein
MKHPRSSRQRYQAFREDYRHRRLDDKTDESLEKKPADAAPAGEKLSAAANGGSPPGVSPLALAHRLSSASSSSRARYAV